MITVLCVSFGYGKNAAKARPRKIRGSNAFPWLARIRGPLESVARLRPWVGAAAAVFATGRLGGNYPLGL